MPLLAALCLINPLILQAQELNNNFAGSSFQSENSSNSSAQQVVAKPELILQTGYNSSLNATRLMFSPDGRLLATATLGSSVIKLWETSTGRELRNLQSGIQNAPGTSPLVAFSRTSRLLATVGADNIVRIWDVVSGRELQTLAQTEHAAQSQDVHFITFGIDDRTLLSVSDAIRVWDVTTGREIRTEQNIVPSLVRGAALSPDGRKLAVIIVENSRPLVRVFDLESPRQPQSINLPNNSTANAQLSFTSNGTLLISAINEGRLRLLDLAAGGRERELGRVTKDSFAELSSNGRFLALSDGQRIKIWDVTKGHQLNNFETFASSDSTSQPPNIVRVSDDGNQVATGGLNSPTVIWNARTGKQQLKLKGRTNQAYKISFSADGNRLFSGGRTFWDLRTGRGLRMLRQPNDQMIGFPSPDGLKLVVAEPNTRILSVFETQTGRQVNRLEARVEGVVQSVSFSRDSSIMAATYSPAKRVSSPDEFLNSGSQIKIWDVGSGRELNTFTLQVRCVDAIFSPDARFIATLDVAGNISLWDSGSGKKLRDITDHNGKATAIAFSEDSTKIAIGSSPSDDTSNSPGEVAIWDLKTNRTSGVFRGSQRSITNVAFTTDGQWIAASATDNTIQIWDVTSQRPLSALKGHTANINSIAFSPNSRLLASAGDDGSTFLWDTKTGDHLLTLISLDDGGEWITVTPQGLFDGTPVAWNQILWRYDHDTFNVAPIEWFFTEFYYPNLLADIFSGKRPRVENDVSHKDRRQPIVKLTGPAPADTGTTSRRVKIRIEITDAAPDKDNPRGTGARDLRLFRNGALVKVWPGDLLKGASSVSLEEDITLTEGANRLTAYAFNRDNVKSKDALLSITGAQSLRRDSTAYIIAVGINEYANPQYNLKYAVADAQAFSQELRQRLSQVLRFDRIEIVPLINADATKANVISALQRLAGSKQTAARSEPSVLETLKQVEPEDTVVIYFAGHGTAQGQRFYLIPYDLGFMGEREILNEQDLQTILSHSISDVELAQAVQGIDAGHLLMFIDACNSGQALEAEEKRRGPMNSKGLAQLAYEKGMYILTAAQSYQAALEAAQLGHGLLTYSLVEEGLKTENADSKPKDGVLTAREWLDFATERVPQLQEEKMKQSRGIGLGLSFTYGEQDIVDPQKRNLQRPRSFYRRELEADPFVVSRSATSPRARSLTLNAPLAQTGLSRWIDLQTVSLVARSRFVQNTQDVTTANQAQYQVQFKGRFKFDQAGKYSLNAGIFTGSRFVLGFNDTGIGTGEPVTNLYLKQLYFSAKPITGVEVQFGGLYFNRGESTEITTYDNDGYLMGERLVVQRPQNFFFDEISATHAFLGDLNTPNINKRWNRLKKSNYHQFLASKRIGERAVVSGDYSFQSGVDTLRQGLRLNTPEFKPIDFFRLEIYERVNSNAAAGLAVYGEKTLLQKRLTLGGGYAQIDPNYGPFNADRLSIGRRYFFNGSYKLTPEFTVSTFYTRAFSNNFQINNHTRFEVLVTYNFLRTLQKTGLF